MNKYCIIEKINLYKKIITIYFIKSKSLIFRFFSKIKTSILKNSMYIYLAIIFNKSLKTIFCYFKKKRNAFDRSLGYPLSKNPKNFDDLTPSIVNDTIYIDSLYWALTNSSVNNIALTGSYGSGKSSILKTLKYKHPEYNYLNISLATFEEEVDKIDSENLITVDQINENKKRRIKPKN
ncbi:hypothetical protein ACM55G_01075 [Flavobacterium sp. LB3P122]